MDYESFLSLEFKKERKRNIAIEIRRILSPMDRYDVATFDYSRLNKETVRTNIERLNAANRGEMHWVYKIDSENCVFYIARDL